MVEYELGWAPVQQTTEESFKKEYRGTETIYEIFYLDKWSIYPWFP